MQPTVPLALGPGGAPGFIALIVVGVIVLAVVCAYLGRLFVKRGMQRPWFVRLVNQATERAVDAIKRPVTIAVLDEVADVLRAGHYTRNVASALRENHVEIKDMVAEKIKADPTAGRIGMVPFHDRIINEVTETTLRVILDVLADPRTDELVSDVLRDNIDQIRKAVRQEGPAAPPPID
jgi:hypothetical protein